MGRIRIGVASCAALALVTTGCAYVSRASQSTQGTQGNGTADEVSLSADGRFVAFRSRANNLVPNDTNGVDGFYADIFVRDALAGTTERVNVASDGTQANFESSAPSLSADARYVAFTSDANNLVPGDTNGSPDVFVRDRGSATTTRIDLDTLGNQTNGASSTSSAAISGDGRFVTFTSSASNLVTGDADGVNDVFVRDRQTAATSRISFSSTAGDPNGESTNASISADGRYVAFESAASNLLAGDTNGNRDVFVRDRQTGTTTRVDTSSSGAEATGGLFPGSFGPAISADGRYVAFVSWATNLVADDTNGLADVFVKDRQTGATTRMSVSTSGDEAVGGTPGVPVSISGDGRYVTFESLATNLVPGDTNGVGDVFVRDRQLATTTRASTSTLLAQGDGESYDPAMSSDGRSVGFSTAATNLVTPDGNGAQDAILRANPLPTVTSATPATVARGTSAVITVNGSNFLPGVTAAFGSGITLTNTNRLSDSQVQFTISVAPAAAAGSRLVFVLITGTGPGAGAGAGGGFLLTVT